MPTTTRTNLVRPPTAIARTRPPVPAGVDDPTPQATALPRGSTIVVLGGVLAGLFLAALD